VLARPVSQGRDNAQQASADQLERFPVLDQVGVVHDECRCGAEVDNAFRCRRHFAELVNMRHDLVAHLGLDFGDTFQVDLIDVRPHRIDRFVADIEVQFALGLGERDPELPPDAGAVARAEDGGHLRGCVAGDQRVLIAVVRHAGQFSCT
jgi:hypothetical protein